jgi:hypothetical protein
MTIPVHLVGSVALDTPAQVLAAAGGLLGPHLRRVPDGEPGGRRLWISWQVPVLRANQNLTVDTTAPGANTWTPVQLRDGVTPEDVHFGELGYAREARVSYQDFCAARDRGELPSDAKFQVALPTPFAVVSPFFTPESSQAVMPAYERAMFAEVQRLTDAIPHDDLAIQWDVCIEMIIWDGQPSIVPAFPGAQEVVKQTLKRCLDAVPADVELGIHLCYGDWDAKHFIEPIDAGKEVDLANTIVALAGRPIAWVHMPVPIARTDDAFYAPLADLRLGPETELYLGLIHADGKDEQRVAAAAKVVADFGIATECGIARQRTPDQVRELIRAHAAVSAEPVGAA